MKVKVYDTFNISPNSSRTYDDKGFMHVSAHVSRTGIQEYRAYELGLDGDQNRIVKVNRSPEEVFSQESLDSFQFIDITPQHEMVNSKNYKELSEGIVINKALQDGDKVKCDFIIKDGNAIESIKGGVDRLSVGYTAEYHKSNNPNYDYEQRNIRANHIMRTNNPRGGNDLKIFDNKGEKKMSHKIKLDDNFKIEVTDESFVTTFENYKNKEQAKFKEVLDENTAIKKQIEELRATSDCLKEENEKLKIQVSDESIKAKIEEVNLVIQQAKTIAGEDFTCESMDSLEIKKKALGLKDKSDEYVNAFFDIKVESAKNTKKAFDSQSVEIAKSIVNDSNNPEDIVALAEKKKQEFNKKYA